MNINDVVIGKVYVFNGVSVKVCDIDTITKNVYITSVVNPKNTVWDKISQWVHVKNLEHYYEK